MEVGDVFGIKSNIDVYVDYWWVFKVWYFSIK